MKFIQLRFKNKDLEHEYQLQMLKLAKKGYYENQIIFSLAIGVLLIDQVMKQNLSIIIMFIGLEVLIIGIICITIKWPVFQNYIQYYFYIFNIGASTIQIVISQTSIFNLQSNDISIYMDMLQQYCWLAHARYNHIGASLISIYFVSTRVYIQICNGYSLASIGYLIFGFYFLIDQYQKAKASRKLFLKSQRNKQLELLIEEFIDDQVSIIEKDEENVKFNILILNKNLSDMANQFNCYLKGINVPQYKSNLLNYLYKSEKQKEKFICNSKTQTYEITYQTYILKKSLIFIKFKKVDHQIDKVINYKDLYQYMIKKLQFRPQKLYRGGSILQTIHLKAFYYQFSRYFIYYKVELEHVSKNFLDYIFRKHQLQTIINCSVKPFQSDKKLLYILVTLIKSIIKEEYLYITRNEEMIKIEFMVDEIISQNKLDLMNKILYHIGLGQTEITKQSSQFRMSIIILDKNGLERFQ